MLRLRSRIIRMRSMDARCTARLASRHLSGSYDAAFAKARKQQKDGRSERRQIVALNPVEQLKADAVELISAWRFVDLQAGGGKVATDELGRERPHRQLSRLYVGPGDVAVLG